MDEDSLEGKQFKSVYDSPHGIIIEFMDGTKAEFSISTYPDGTTRSVEFYK